MFRARNIMAEMLTHCFACETFGWALTLKAGRDARA